MGPEAHNMPLLGPAASRPLRSGIPRGYCFAGPVDSRTMSMGCTVISSRGGCVS